MNVLNKMTQKVNKNSEHASETPEEKFRAIADSGSDNYLTGKLPTVHTKKSMAVDDLSRLWLLNYR